MKQKFKIKSLEYKKAEHLLSKINLLEPEIKKLDDKKLQNKTNEFKKRLEDGAKIDDLIVEAFAVAREACWRVLEKRPLRNWSKILPDYARHPKKSKK